MIFYKCPSLVINNMNCFAFGVCSKSQSLWIWVYPLLVIGFMHSACVWVRKVPVSILKPAFNINISSPPVELLDWKWGDAKAAGHWAHRCKQEIFGACVRLQLWSISQDDYALSQSCYDKRRKLLWCFVKQKSGSPSFTDSYRGSDRVV